LIQSTQQRVKKKGFPMNQDAASTTGTDHNDDYDTVETMALSITDPSIVSSKRVVYMGGLAEGVTVPMVRAALIPFGEIHTIDMVRSNNDG
jgi:hypothetical protein